MNFVIEKKLNINTKDLYFRAAEDCHKGPFNFELKNIERFKTISETYPLKLKKKKIIFLQNNTIFSGRNQNVDEEQT